MSRFAGTLSPIKINPKHQEALRKISEKLETTPSQLVRQAIAEFIERKGLNLDAEALQTTSGVEK
jgi:predicted transcriptional regulator